MYLFIPFTSFPVFGAERGYGLQGVRERLELIGGSLRVESTPNQGTTLWVAIPKNPVPVQL